jgi:ribosomal protein S18 acetylase RimI-like enzyme
MRIQSLDLRDASLCRKAWHLQREAYELEAALIGSRGMQALNESEADLAANATEAFHGCFLGTVDNTKLVGVIATEVCEHPSCPTSPKEWWISRLAVAPAFARRGIGRALVLHVIEHAASGVGLRVSTAAANLPAVRLYQSVGFAIVKNATAPDGTQLVRLVLRRWS